MDNGNYSYRFDLNKIPEKELCFTELRAFYLGSIIKQRILPILKDYAMIGKYTGQIKVKDLKRLMADCFDSKYDDDQIEKRIIESLEYCSIYYHCNCGYVYFSWDQSYIYSYISGLYLFECTIYNQTVDAFLKQLSDEVNSTALCGKLYLRKTLTLPRYTELQQYCKEKGWRVDQLKNTDHNTLVPFVDTLRLVNAVIVCDNNVWLKDVINSWSLKVSCKCECKHKYFLPIENIKSTYRFDVLNFNENIATILGNIVNIVEHDKFDKESMFEVIFDKKEPDSEYEMMQNETWLCKVELAMKVILMKIFQKQNLKIKNISASHDRTSATEYKLKLNVKKFLD